MFFLSVFIDRKLSKFPTNKCHSDSEHDFNKFTRSHERTLWNLCVSNLLQREQPATCVFLPKYLCGIIVFFDFPRCVYAYNNKRVILGKMNGKAFVLDRSRCWQFGSDFW